MAPASPSSGCRAGPAPASLRARAASHAFFPSPRSNSANGTAGDAQYPGQGCTRSLVLGKCSGSLASSPRLRSPTAHERTGADAEQRENRPHDQSRAARRMSSPHIGKGKEAAQRTRNAAMAAAAGGSEAPRGPGGTPSSARRELLGRRRVSLHRFMTSGPRVDLSHRNAVGRRPRPSLTRPCGSPSPQVNSASPSRRVDWTPPLPEEEALNPQTSDRPGCKGPRTRSATTRGAMRTWRDRTRYATRIQAAWRRWRLCKADIMVRLRARGAARSVQRWWRMLQSKQRLQVILARLWWRLTIDMLQVDGAARRLQGGVRMVLLRKFRRSAVVAAPRIQTWWRGASVRLALQRLLEASVALQRWRRRQLQRRRLRSIISQAVAWEKSARRVQSAWRGSRTRKQHAKEIDLLRKARTKRKAVIRKAQLEGRRRILSQPVRRELGIPVRAASKLQQGAGEEQEPRTMQAPGVNRTGTGSWKPQLKKLVLDNRLLLDGRLERLTKSPRQQAALSPRDSRNLSSSLNVSRSPRNSAIGSSIPLHPPASKNVDADLLVAELMSCGLVSSTPRAPPWPHEQPGRSDIEAVRSWLSVSLPTSEVRTVLRVESTLATAAYTAVSKTLGPERLLWHGTAWDSVANIVRHGFNRAYSGRHGAKLGRGSYFAEDAAYALRFCGRSTPRALFLAGVLPGRMCRGEENLVEPPADKSDASGARYDSTVDDPERPKVFCVFKDFQALPLYLAEIA